MFTQGSPFNPLMTIAAAVALVVLCVKRIKSGRRVELFRASLFWAATTCLLVLTGLYLSYWAGGVSGFVSGRFYLAFSCIFAVITCAACAELLSRSRVSAGLAIAFGSTAFLYSVHQVEHVEYFNGSLAPIELRRMNEYIDAHPAEGRLYAYHLPVELTMRGESAVRIRTVNEEIESFSTMIQHAGIRDIIVFQRAHTDSGRIHPLMQVRPDILLERLEAYPDGIYELRVSRVTQIGDIVVGETETTQVPRIE